MAFIEYGELRTRIPPLDEIMRMRYGITLKRSGKELKGCCPFHDDHDPSMSVTTERGGAWYCHTCGEGGGVLEFVRRMEGLRNCNEAAELLDREYLNGELAANAPTPAHELQRREEIKIQTSDAWKRGIEIVEGLAADREFLGDDKGAEDLRGLLDGLVFDTSDPESSLESIRAIITAFGGDGAELDEISPNRGLKPSDFSDVAEGRLFASEYGDKVLYHPVFGWMVYDGTKWKEDEAGARAYAHALTDRQLAEAETAVMEAKKKELAAARGTTDEKEAAKKAVKNAEAFYNYIVKRRDTKRIAAALTEAVPSLVIEADELDRHPLYLNTPRGTVNLETGRMKPHDHNDLLTTVTASSPSDVGRERWERFVMEVSDGDKELADFLKVVCGMCVCGVVLDELLVIANGTGGNGKSTFWNAIQRTLNDYSGNIKPDTLIAQEGQQKRFELADLRGKRLALAPETEDGQHLDGSMVKRICSTDKIRGERKYKDSFDFIPSHHLVLFTNHLPIVDSVDNGTWARLLVVPFTATFRDTGNEKKNLAEILTEECGGAIVQWCIEGAAEYLRLRKLPAVPEIVKTATDEYRARNDRLHAWIQAECETGRRCSESSTALLEAFNTFAKGRGEDTMSKDFFAKQIKSKGFTIAHTKTGNVVNGVKLSENKKTR